MNPTDIRALIKKRGAAISAIAESLEVSEAAVRGVIDGNIKSRRIAKRIADFTGRKVDDLWPGRYPAKYRRKATTTAAEAMLAALELRDRRAA